MLAMRAMLMYDVLDDVGNGCDEREEKRRREESGEEKYLRTWDATSILSQLNDTIVDTATTRQSVWKEGRASLPRQEFKRSRRPPDIASSTHNL